MRPHPGPLCRGHGQGAPWPGPVSSTMKTALAGHSPRVCLLHTAEQAGTEGRSPGEGHSGQGPSPWDILTPLPLSGVTGHCRAALLKSEQLGPSRAILSRRASLPPARAWAPAACGFCIRPWLTGSRCLSFNSDFQRKTGMGLAHLLRQVTPWIGRWCTGCHSPVRWTWGRMRSCDSGPVGWSRVLKKAAGRYHECICLIDKKMV